MIPVLLIMTFGIVIGWFFHKREKLLNLTSKLTNWAIFLLLFLLGLSVGTNEKILNNFENIGFQAILITLFAVFGSIIVSWITYLIFFKKNEG